MLMIFLLLTLQCAYDVLDIIESCHDYDLNTISEQTTRSHHGTNSETSIQWCSLKYHPTLKSHSNAKLHIILEQNGTFQNH